MHVVFLKADAAVSSLSGTVGGPVWMNGQSMKPHLTGVFFFLLKMYLLIVLQGYFEEFPQIAPGEGLCLFIQQSGLWSYFLFFARQL